ncbi:MAG: HlyD family efflux transporter periplasmic adaptor subunit [Caulobacteraceae bacterium]
MNPIDEEAVGAETRPGALARWRWPLMIGGPVVVLAVVAWFILTGGRFESTDDAYVNRDKAPISAAIAGRVVEVDVTDNQHVKAGQVLFKLDPADEVAADARAAAAVATAKLQVVSLRAAYDNQKLQLAQALRTQAYALREAARQKALLAAGVASARQAADAQHTADVAVSQVSIARQQVATALANLGAGATNAGAYPAVMQAKATRQSTSVNLSRTVVYAPRDGIVARVDQLQVGAYVNPAQTLFFLLSGEPWVDANFKEDQLRYMRVGQPASIVVDALGRKLPGHVASFSPGSGSAFSALPAENATGNWVKVAQRLPVRIAFDKPPPDVAGRAGLSATVTVDVRSGRNAAARRR